MSNGLCSFAVQQLIPPGDNDPPIRPRIAILHVDGGNAYNLHDYFNGPSGGIESHFHIAKDGTIFQYRSIFRQADANYRANDFAVSIETQGYGSGEWTAAQLKSIKRLLIWINKETLGEVPLRVCDVWNGSGIGYHIQFGTPGPWTPDAKACPGADRILQFRTDLTSWLKLVSNPSSERTLEMATEEQVKQWMREVLYETAREPNISGAQRMHGKDRRGRLRVWAEGKLLWYIKNKLDVLQQDVNDIKSHLQK